MERDIDGGLGERLPVADGGCQRLVHRGRLEDDADAGAPVEACAGRIGPQHLDLAAVARPVALEDLDRGRLACAVGAEQAEDLAGPEVEVDPLQRLELAVALAEAADADDGGHGRRI